MEKEVVVLSIAVSRPGGFATDAQRLNVALTRAKRHLIVVGDLAILPHLGPAFKSLLDRAAQLPGGVCSVVETFAPHAISAQC